MGFNIQPSNGFDPNLLQERDQVCILIDLFGLRPGVQMSRCRTPQICICRTSDMKRRCQPLSAWIMPGFSSLGQFFGSSVSVIQHGTPIAEQCNELVGGRFGAPSMEIQLLHCSHAVAFLRLLCSTKSPPRCIFPDGKVLVDGQQMALAARCRVDEAARDFHPLNAPTPSELARVGDLTVTFTPSVPCSVRKLISAWDRWRSGTSTP